MESHRVVQQNRETIVEMNDATNVIVIGLSGPTCSGFVSILRGCRSSYYCLIASMALMLF